MIIVNSSLKLCNCCSKNFSQRRVCWLSQKLHTVLKQCGWHNITDKLITTQQVYFCLASKVTKNTTMDPLCLDILVTWKILCSTTLHSLFFMHKIYIQKAKFQKKLGATLLKFHWSWQKKYSWLKDGDATAPSLPRSEWTMKGLKIKAPAFQYSYSIIIIVAIQSLSRSSILLYI